ncbi:hypothetical protein BKA93DRAFT_751464 [Sparassis latifolia]
MADLCKRTDQKQFQLRESRDDRGSIVYRGLYEDVNEDGQLKGEFLDDDSDRGETFLVNHNHIGSPPLSNDESKESDKLDNTKEEHKETIHQPLSYVPVSNVEEDIKEDVEEESKAEAKDEDEDEASVPALPSYLRQWNMTEQMQFECLACTIKRDRGAMQLIFERYQGLYSVPSTEKSWVPLMKGLWIVGKRKIALTTRLDTTSLVLVHLHLHLLPVHDTIANLVEKYLRAYYVDRSEFLNWLDVIFDLEGSEATEGHHLHMLNIVSKI